VTVSAAHLRGVPLLFVAPGAIDAVQALALLVKGDGPLRGAKDLNGKIIAVNALRSMSTVSISSWIDGNGGDSKTVKFIEYPIPQMAAAVASGTVDAAFPPEPFVTSAVDAGERAIVMQKGMMKNYMLSGWIATTSFLVANPATVSKFVAAIREATEISNRRPLSTDAAEIVVKYTKIPSTVVGHLLYIAPFGLALDAHQLQPLIDASAKYGVIDRQFAAADIIYGSK
jgi:NitT/TauT family transport system substrate-binding protein